MTGPRVPWRSERELSSDDVRALVREQFELPARSVAILGTGWDSEAYLVDETWVFRFPKRAEVVASLRNELALLPLLGPRLPLPIPAPRFIGEPCKRFPFPFAGHRLVPGVPAEDTPGADKQRVLGSLFELLAVLHSIELEGPFADVEGWDFDAAVESAGYVRRLGLDGEPKLQRAGAWLAERAPRSQSERVLLHGDLGFEHVLLDPSGRVSGVIDWGDMEIGARAHDFVGALDYAGVDAVEQALARSTYPASPHLVEDARTLLVHRAVVWWCEAVEYRLPEGTTAAANQIERFTTP